MNTNVVHIEPATRAEYWADRITKSHAASVEQIVQTGRELLAAKAKLPHGEWGRLTGQANGRPLLPFGRITAQRHMQVAQHAALSNSSHGNYLPNSWRTLAELSQLPAPTVESFIGSGVIHPDLTRSDAEAMVREWQAAQNTGARPMFQPEQPAAPAALPYAKPPEPDPERVAALETTLAETVAALQDEAKHMAAIHEGVRGVTAPQGAWAEVLGQMGALAELASSINESFSERPQPLPPPSEDMRRQLSKRLSEAMLPISALIKNVTKFYEDGASDADH